MAHFAFVPGCASLGFIGAGRSLLGSKRKPKSLSNSELAYSCSSGLSKTACNSVWDSTVPVKPPWLLSCVISSRTATS